MHLSKSFSALKIDLLSMSGSSSAGVTRLGKACQGLDSYVPVGIGLIVLWVGFALHRY